MVRVDLPPPDRHRARNPPPPSCHVAPCCLCLLGVGEGQRGRGNPRPFKHLNSPWNLDRVCVSWGKMCDGGRTPTPPSGASCGVSGRSSSCPLRRASRRLPPASRTLFAQLWSPCAVPPHPARIPGPGWAGRLWRRPACRVWWGAATLGKVRGCQCLSPLLRDPHPRPSCRPPARPSARPCPQCMLP
jgi:hypothetical protein